MFLPYIGVGRKEKQLTILKNIQNVYTYGLKIMLSKFKSSGIVLGTSW